MNKSSLKISQTAKIRRSSKPKINQSIKDLQTVGVVLICLLHC